MPLDHRNKEFHRFMILKLEPNLFVISSTIIFIIQIANENEISRKYHIEPLNPCQIFSIEMHKKY